MFFWDQPGTLTKMAPRPRDVIISIHWTLLRSLGFCKNASNLLTYQGPVQFENNERLGLVEILQWRNGSYMLAGIYDGTETSLTLNSALQGILHLIFGNWGKVSNRQNKQDSASGLLWPISQTLQSQSMHCDVSDWVPPLDATVVVRKRQYISLVLFILLSLLAAIGVALAIFFLIANIKYRNHRFVLEAVTLLNTFSSHCTRMLFGPHFEVCWKQIP